MHGAGGRTGLFRLATGGVAMAAATSLTLLGAPMAHAGGEATLTITPDELSGPCEGVQLVQFTAAGFVPDEPIAFTFKKPTGKRIGQTVTDDSGGTARTFKFNTAKIPPRTFTFWAVQRGGPAASATFTETTCE